MLNRIALIPTILSALTSVGADKKYPVSDIPEELKREMYAVVREAEQVITIIDINKYTYSVRKVVTILNKNGDDLASEDVFYDKLTKISSFKGTSYDAEGNVIKKLKAPDFYDRSYVSSSTLYDDNRIKSASLSNSIYPYTVEFEYEVTNNYLYSFPNFYLYNDDEVSIQKISYVVKYNPKFPPRYKTFKIPEPGKSIDSDGRTVLTWEFKNIRPDKWEPYSPDHSKFVPNILVSPGEFEYSGYRGNMNTWEDYCNWEKLLMQGRDELPVETKSKILEITKPASLNEEKIRLLYEYMQSKTRYVNISLGIGGLQPIPASTVDQVGYGDCKALSNYMIAMLKVVGIQGFYSTIRAGDGAPEVEIGFPSHQGNHVIVSVPNGRDTIWLECTSQITSYGYLGNFTGGRKALLNTPKGGQWVNTPFYAAEKNLQTRTVDVELFKTGDARASVRTTYSGLQYENGGLDYAITLSAEKQKEWIQKNTGIPNFDLLGFKMNNKKARNPFAVVSAEYSLRKLATVNGKRIFLTPNIMNRSSNIPPKLDNRKTDVVIRYGYVDFDTLVFTIPEEIYPEFTPEPVKITSQFGEYEAQFLIDQNKLTYIRKMKLKDGTYPPESYNELIDFRKSVNKADNTKVVFMSKT